jgi:GNAT superfamily N-acetyltransferase
VRDLAGGILTFSGMPGSLSEGIAIGIESDVSARVVEEITSFFRSHHCPARVVVCPIANPELAPLLARAGYVPVEGQNTLVGDLAAIEGRRHGRIQEMRDPHEWAEASARGFLDGSAPDAIARKVSLVLATGGATVLEVRDDGAIVATACYAFEEDNVVLFAASTLPSYRRQGWQRAMIRERIARAKDAGMRFARVTAVPLSDSERNFRALGFVPLYTRVTWELRS